MRAAVIGLGLIGASLAKALKNCGYEIYGYDISEEVCRRAAEEGLISEKAEKEKREPQLLPPFSCHKLRHTFCTRFCENETNIKVIQDIMDHADISTTMNIYAEATESKKRESFENLQGKIKIS